MTHATYVRVLTFVLFTDEFVSFSLLATVSDTYLGLVGVVTFLNLILLLSVLHLSLRFRALAYTVQQGGTTFI